MPKRLAMTKDGVLTYCSASDENIGKGRCNHVSHQKNGQSIEDYIKSVQKDIESNSFKKLSLKEVKSMYENGQNIDELKKINKKTVVDYLVSQGEKDFPELAKNGSFEVKHLLAVNKCNLDILKDDKDEFIRRRIASKGINLENYLEDKSHHVRMEVARHGYGLDKLSNDEHYAVREEVARRGYNLDKFVKDESQFVRGEVAKKGYALEQLVNDESAWVREQVARKGYGLDKLVDDPDSDVRRAVALQGYEIGKLLNDKSQSVREAAQSVLARGV